MDSAVPHFSSNLFSNTNTNTNITINRSPVVASPFHFNHLLMCRSLAMPQPQPQPHIGGPAVRLRHTAALQDAAATVAVTAGAYVLVYTFDNLTQRQFIQQILSRKIVHILSGVLFMSSWPIFSSSPEARYFAAIVPLLNCARLIIYGTRLFKDEALIKSVTREGNPEELLRGPLYYVMALLLSVLVFWRDSPVGIISLSMMTGGDGVADIIGRKYGSTKLPYNRKKSWIGSISMFVCGFLLSIGMLYYFSILGYLHLDWDEATLKVALISVVATLVESLPITDVLDDNISVPIASMSTALVLFGQNGSS